LPRKKKSSGGFDEAKRRVTARLLPLDFVSGVGGSDKLSVMLERPISDAEHDHIRTVMQNEAEGYDYNLVDTGKFTKR
jgi:hypothetical protein